MQILPAYHYQFSALLTSIASICLVVLVFKKSVDDDLKRKFAFYYSSLFVWSLSVFVCTSVYNYHISYFFCQSTHIAADFIPVFFLHFTYVYLGLDKKLSRKILLLICYITAIIFAAIIAFYPKIFFNDIVPKLSFPYFPNAGVLYLPWMISFGLVVLIAHATLFKAMLQASGMRKKQIRFFLVANLLGYTGGIGCFLPVYNLPYFPFPYGPYGVLLLSFVSGYTILRHRFIDLKILVKNTLIFASLFGSIMAIFSFVVFLSQNILVKVINPNPFLSTAISVVIMIVAYDPLRNFLLNVTDKYFFQKKVDYRTLLKEASQHLGRLKSLKKQARRIVSFLTKKARINNASVFVFTETDNALACKACRNSVKHLTVQRIKLSDPIIQYLYNSESSFTLEEFREGKKDVRDKETRIKMNEIEDLMISLDAEAAIPCFGGEDDNKKEIHLKGILFLGHQKSDESYYHDDLLVFDALAQESAIAFENARLYDESEEKRRELQQINSQVERANTDLIRALEQLESSKRKEEEMQRELAQREKMAIIGALVSGIEHETRNPMGIAYTVAEMIKIDMEERKIKPDFESFYSRIEKDIDVIIAQISRAKNKMEVITDFAKPELKPEKKLINVYELIDQALEECRVNVNPKVKVVKDIQNGVKLMGEKRMIHHVLVNLITNACHAMINRTENAILRITAKNEDSKAILSITDTGDGIPEDKKNMLFMSFFSTKDTARNSSGLVQKGTGLGLFISKQIVEKHGGKIWFISEEGKGTTFFTEFPLIRSDE